MKAIRKLKITRISKNKLILVLSLGVVLAIVIYSLISKVINYIPPQNTKADLPSKEKVAEGVWKLNNYDPIKEVLTEGKKADLNLKEVKIDKSKLKSVGKNTEQSKSSIATIYYDTLKYRWSVTNTSGTKFEFGGVDQNTPDGKVLPIVKITNKEGYFVAYSSSNDQLPINNFQYVAPKVKDNIIEWEIAKGITARYTMQADRVKADYIVNSKESIVNGKLEFEVQSGSSKDNNLIGELLPGGDIDWFANEDDESIKTQFTFPKPVVYDSSKAGVESARGGLAGTIDSEYKLRKVIDGNYKLDIILDKNDLEKAEFPIVVDPVVIDSFSLTNATAYGNGRKILRDGWGNLIAVFDGYGVINHQVLYKNYDSSTWTDTNITIDDLASSFAADLDSTGSAHIVFQGVEIQYLPLKITRSGNNTISSIETQARFSLDSSGIGVRPSLIVANKGGGAGVEKVVVAYAMNTTVGGSRRGEIRVMQCDIGDACNVAANWKNVSEEINGSGTCSDVATSGAAGLPNTTSCKGTADALFAYTAAHTTHHSDINQLPGKTKRTPAGFEHYTGVFQNVGAAIDGNTSTDADVSVFTTGQYVYIGDNRPFSKISIDFAANNVNAATFTTREYWNGVSWTKLTNFIDNTATATTTFNEDGSIMFDEPGNWATTAVNGKTMYWVRISPSASMDTAVYIYEVYVNDRNSKALVIMGGVDAIDDLGVAYVPWDEVGNAGWENNPASAGIPWRENIIALDTLGANYTTYTNFPLSTAVDYKNNSIYVAYVEDTTTDVLHVKYASQSASLTSSTVWVDTGFPTVTEGTDIAYSLVSDGADIYLFYVLDPGANSLVYRKCTPSGGGNLNICDNANDWGSEKTLDNGTDNTHPQALVTKVTGDTNAIDLIYTTTTSPAVEYERHYVDNADNTVAVAASGDDALQMDCVSGTDDQIINSNNTVGRIQSDVPNCGGVDSLLHSGFRFQNITIDQGAKISSAYIDLRVYTRTGSTEIPLSIYGEDVDNSSSFTAFTDCADPCSNGVNTRTKTTSSSSSSINYATNTYRIDVTKQVQEIICRGAANSQPCVGDYYGSGTWASGNALSILIISTEPDNGVNNYAGVQTYDLAPAFLPTLQINVAPESTGDTSWCSIGGGGNAAGDCNANWGSRKRLAFDNRASGTNLTDFPVLVRLDSSNIDYTKTQGGGQDLRFVDADGSTLLDYEIEEWDENGESQVFVKVPQINSASTTDYVWMYYNNSSASSGEDITNTWDSYNKGVWHLNEGDSTTSNFYQDSTTNNNDGTLTDVDGSTNQVTGVVGKAMDFGPRDEDIITIVNSNSLNNTGSGWGASNPFTLSTWIYFDDAALTYQYMISKDASGSNAGDASLLFNNGASCNPLTPVVSFYHQPPAKCATSPQIEQNKWYHYVFTINGSDQGMLYQNGVLVATTATYGTIWNNAYDIRFGNAVSSTFSFTGKIDEVRISGGIARSADWAEAEYLSTRPNSTYVSVSPEQTATSANIIKYSLGSQLQIATGSGSIADLDHAFSSWEYIAVEGNDNSYVDVAAVNNYASTSAQPAFMFKVNNSNNNNSNKIDASAIVKSNIATSDKPVYLQVYRGGSTDDWVTVASNNSTAADTDFTLNASISENLSEYYFNETPGIGIQYAECTNGTANCWTYWRIYQDAQNGNLNEILSLDYVDISFTDFVNILPPRIRGGTRLQGGSRIR